MELVITLANITCVRMCDAGTAGPVYWVEPELMDSLLEQ